MAKAAVDVVMVAVLAVGLEEEGSGNGDLRVAVDEVMDGGTSPLVGEAVPGDRGC